MTTGGCCRGAGTGGRSLGAGTGGRSLGAGTGGRSLGAGTGGRSLGAGTGGRSLGAGTGGRSLGAGTRRRSGSAGTRRRSGSAGTRRRSGSAGTRRRSGSAGTRRRSGSATACGLGLAEGGGSGLRRMELLRRQGGSLGLGKREPLERYAEEFLELSNRVSWHVAALGACFLLGLDDEVIRCDLPDSDFPLIELINLIFFLNGSDEEVEEIPRPRHPTPAGTRRISPAHPTQRPSAYLSNLRPPCRNPHSPSSAEVISNFGSSILSRVYGGARNEETMNFF